MARKYGSRPVSKATDVFLSIPPKCQDSKHSPHSGNNVFSNHQNMSYLSASTVKLPPPQPPLHTRGIEWLKLIRPHDATYLGQIIAQIQRLSFATRSKVTKWHAWSTGPCGIGRMVPGRPCTSHTHNYCTHFFLMNSQIHSHLPIPPLLAPIQHHSAAWQHLFIGGKKNTSLFSCHSQQLSQGSCL